MTRSLLEKKNCVLRLGLGTPATEDHKELSLSIFVVLGLCMCQCARSS